MTTADSVVAAVGRTPLIKLKRASEATGCTILGKAEFMNPGQSVKDRAALYIIQDAVKRGELRPGGTVVEGTAGNTGIGLDPHRQCARLPQRHRHSRNAEPGEEGHAAPARRRADRGAGRPLQEPQQLREVFARGWPRRWPRPSPTAPSGPTSSTTSPTGRRTSRPRPRRSGPTPTARSTASSRAVGSGGTLGGVSMALKAKRKNIQIALADVAGRRAATATTPPASSRPRAPRSPKASARAASPRTSKAWWSTRPTAFPTPRRCRSSSTS